MELISYKLVVTEFGNSGQDFITSNLKKGQRENDISLFDSSYKPNTSIKMLI